MLKGFIPATKKEVDDLGWKRPDVIIVTGDAYIDHAAFQVAAIGRFLNNNGIRTAILDMPDVEEDKDWTLYGRPALMFLVISGKEDSMAMNYTAFRKFRSTDPYVPGGKRTHRPDRACIKYCGKIKQFFKDVPVVLTGAEAVCRMSTHYDFWTDKLRKPILFDSKADMVLFGNAEHNLLKICELLRSRYKISEIKKLNGTAYIEKDISDIKGFKFLPEHDQIVSDPKILALHHIMIHKNQNPYNSEILIQKVLNRYLVIHKALNPLDAEETDEVINAGFLKRPHPKYKEEIPIYRFVKDTVVSHRGCLNDIYDSQDIFTEGRFVSSRSAEWVKKEALKFIKSKLYNKILRVFGGPYFNHYSAHPGNRKMCAKCERLSCAMPDVCKNLKTENGVITGIMSVIDSIPNVRNNYFGGCSDIKLLLSEKELYKDFLVNRNDGNVDITVRSFKDEVRKASGLDTSEDIIKDIRFLIKRSGEYRKNLKFRINISAGLPGQSEEEVRYNLSQIEQTGVEIGDINMFVPLPITLSSVAHFLGTDPVTGEHIEPVKSISAVKRSSEVYKRFRKSGK